MRGRRVRRGVNVVGIKTHHREIKDIAVIVITIEIIIAEIIIIITITIIRVILLLRVRRNSFLILR